jgi:hypothetical protein
MHPKLTFLLIALSVSFFSCNEQPIDKVKAGIKSYVITNFNDPDSYEPIEFGKLDTIMSSYPEEDFFWQLEHKKDSIKTLINFLSEFVGNNSERNFHIEEKKDSLLKYNSVLVLKQDSMMDIFEPKFQNYLIEHKFRAKNNFGALILNNYRFYLDSTFKVYSVDKL